MLYVRSIFPDSDKPDQHRVESTSFELTPTNSQGEAVCCLFERYLSERPPAFREKLSFLRKGDLELDWSAVTGGVALASMFQHETPVCMAVLLAGADPAIDETMLDLFRENVLVPLLGNDCGDAIEVPERPLLVQIFFPGSPEWLPALQLLMVSLASVYFRTILNVSRSSPAKQES